MIHGGLHYVKSDAEKFFYDISAKGFLIEFPISLRKRFIHFYNLKYAESKLNSLFTDFKCGTIREVL